MEKKVESLKSSSAAAVTTQTLQPDGKELVRLFQNMSVKTLSSPSADSLWRNTCKDTKMHKVLQPSSIKFKKRTKKKLQQPSSSTAAAAASLPRIRPSKLKPKTENGTTMESSRLFSDFSAACSRELDTIAVAKAEDQQQPQSEKRPQKKRKASASCAQQARNECSLSNNDSSVDISIDFLTDYLEETILFPKKMSYMAELMYT